MDDALAVGVFQGRSNLFGNTECLLNTELLLVREATAQGVTLDVRRYIVDEPGCLARVMQREDVGVVQTGRNGDLAEKPLGSYGGGNLRLEHLDGDLAVVLEVLGEIHGRHPSGANRALDAIPVRQGGVDVVRCLHHASQDDAERSASRGAPEEGARRRLTNRG